MQDSSKFLTPKGERCVILRTVEASADSMLPLVPGHHMSFGSIVLLTCDFIFFLVTLPIQPSFPLGTCKTSLGTCETHHGVGGTQGVKGSAWSAAVIDMSWKYKGHLGLSHVSLLIGEYGVYEPISGIIRYYQILSDIISRITIAIVAKVYLKVSTHRFFCFHNFRPPKGYRDC